MNTTKIACLLPFRAEVKNQWSYSSVLKYSFVACSGRALTLSVLRPAVLIHYVSEYITAKLSCYSCRTVRNQFFFPLLFR
jgi:hypothetical protein